MLCEACGNELHIVGSRVTVQGDDSPATPTRVLLCQTLRCRNPACAQRPPVQAQRVLYPPAESAGAPADT